MIERHDAALLGEHQKARLSIERDEPPVRRALDRMCYNDIVRAEYDRVDAQPLYLPLTWWQRLTAQLFEHANVSS